MDTTREERHGKKRKTGPGKGRRTARNAAIVLAAAAGILILIFGIYVSDYYRADAAAKAALASDEVRVEETEYGWFFDGPSEDTAMVFYPGAKVEETAYAPLLHGLAAAGMDVCLAKMPFRLAVLGANAAEDIMELYSYENWYIGGHSLGGAMAADYAAGHGDDFSGLILLAAYPVKEIPSSMSEILLVGSQDRVINRDKLAQGREYAPQDYTEYIIEGGNHAQFGSYGPQKGDGNASITARQQTEETIERIAEFTGR